MRYDVAVIGGGVTGSFVARELMRYRLKVCILEAESDLAFGSSGANSGIVHGGFDPQPGTWKARFNIEGCRMMGQVASELDVPYRKIGSLVCAHHENELGALGELRDRGRENGVEDLRILSSQEVGAIEPNLAKTVKGALFCPDSGVISPYELTIAAAENAVQNGAELFLDAPVTGIGRNGGVWEVDAGRGSVFATCVVNAAGLFADRIHEMALRAEHDSAAAKRFKIIPRRGEYLLLDQSQGDVVGHVIFRIPNEKGKGILAAPTADGNLLLGPTSIRTEEREDKSTTPEGIGQVKRETQELGLPIDYGETITAFAGLRASSDAEHGDFIIEESLDGFYNAAGIDSPGLTASPAIGRYVARMIAEKLDAGENGEFQPCCRPRIRFSRMSDEEREKWIGKDVRFANMICRCEMVTEGEIIDAIRRPAGARTVDGVKKRTRAGMGRCQGGFCMPKVIDILAREQNLSPLEIKKSGAGAELLQGYLKGN